MLNSENIQKTTKIIAAIFIIVVILVIVWIFQVLQSKKNELVNQKKQNTMIQSSYTQDQAIFSVLPATFPHDFPMISNGRVTDKNDSDESWSAAVLVGRSVDSASTFYDTELPKAGWQITSASQAGGVKITYATKDTRTAIVTIGQSDKGTVVSITILKK